MLTREPVVEGLFYPSREKTLYSYLDRFFSDKKLSKEFEAIIVPHAGWEYSGNTCAFGIAEMNEFPTFVILCPNHTGYGLPLSVFPEGKWKTLLGEIEIDSDLSERIVSINKDFGFDEEAHFQEHAIETILPFLQHRFGSAFKLVAICIGTENQKASQQLGKTLAELSRQKKFGLIASSDFSHYVPLETAQKKDNEAIKEILSLNSEKFGEKRKQENWSICGFAPIETAMEFSKQKKLKARLLNYDTSATASGNKSSVVGYASIGFKK